jgi:4-amino-4-deoxy-L-arabinose transferase-like glycosyltransferase
LAEMPYNIFIMENNIQTQGKLNKFTAYLQKYSAELNFIGLVLLFGLLAWMFFYKLGVHPFIDWDESLYAQVAKESLQNHHLLNFTSWDGQWFEKPPLMIWLIAVGYKLFGINELGGRFFVAVFSFFTSIVIYLLAKELFKSKIAGWLCVGVLLICHNFFWYAFILNFDIPVGFFILLTIYGFIKGQANPKYFYLFWLALALGVMTKSVIGFLPLPILFMYSLASKDFKYLKTKQFYYGIGLFLLIVAPWHIWETVKNGKNFWNNYLLYQVFRRYSSGIENNGGPFWTYLEIFKVNPVLTILTVISIIYSGIKSFSKRVFALPLIASLFIFFFFSSAATKGYSYILVIYPYLALMIGSALNDIISLIKSAYARAFFACLLMSVFIFSGTRYEFDKVPRSNNDPYFQDSKFVGLWLKQNYPDALVYTDAWYNAGPAVFYYYGKQIPGLPESVLKPAAPTMVKAQLLLHRLTRDVIKVNDYIVVTR